jgi:hypothetical protein
MTIFKIYIPINKFSITYQCDSAQWSFYEINACCTESSHDCSANTPQAQRNAEYYRKGFYVQDGRWLISSVIKQCNKCNSLQIQNKLTFISHVLHYFTLNMVAEHCIIQLQIMLITFPAGGNCCLQHHLLANVCHLRVCYRTLDYSMKNRHQQNHPLLGTANSVNKNSGQGTPRRIGE